ncbi:MAG: FAD-dependent oxidoreductase [Lachnospiraceae bacterium]
MKKVLIIGAGPAGLTAAYELLKTGEYDVTVLERSQDIGGISKTVRYRDNRMDIGGHRFFSKDDRVMQWWADMMPLQGAPAMDDRLLNRQVPLTPGGPDPEKEDRVMLTRNRVSRIYYQHHFFDYPISLKWETLKTMGFATTMQVGLAIWRPASTSGPTTIWKISTSIPSARSYTPCSLRVTPRSFGAVIPGRSTPAGASSAPRN